MQNVEIKIGACTSASTSSFTSCKLWSNWATHHQWMFLHINQAGIHWWSVV